MNKVVVGFAIFLFIACLALAILASFDYFGLVMATLPLLLLYGILFYYYRTSQANAVAKAEAREDTIVAELITKHDRPV